VNPETDNKQVADIVSTPGLADALESDRFKQFLDHVPVAIAVSELHPSEFITYANVEFERLTGLAVADIEGRDWSTLPGVASRKGDETSLSDAVEYREEYLGTFTLDRDGEPVIVDAWSNTIENDQGVPLFRLVALAGTGAAPHDTGDQRHQMLRDSDALLLELQHRVKNNLQMVTALIRMEARNVRDAEASARFDRLAGRINSLALLYKSLAGEGLSQQVDLGTYLSQIASSVMQAHAVEGIRLELKVDSWPVSINVAMPAGLVVNELFTNALKHAFVGQSGGTISLTSLVDETGCRVVVADDGIGLAPGESWPKPGKLGAVIVQSLRQNAKADLEVDSRPGQGLRVSILFDRADATPTVVKDQEQGSSHQSDSVQTG
jgi:PAS domain S-box-containing protein